MLNFRWIVISRLGFFHNNTFLALFLFLLQFVLISYVSLSFLYYLFLLLPITVSLLLFHSVSSFFKSISILLLGPATGLCFFTYPIHPSLVCVELNICPQIAAINYSNWNSCISYVKCSINNVCACARNSAYYRHELVNEWSILAWNVVFFYLL